MKKNICYFGVEVEFTTSFGKLETMLRVLDKHGDILLSGNDKYLFRDPSIVPTGIYELGYEVKTKKLVVSKVNEQKVTNFIIELSSIVTANDTCSMHLHFSRKGANLVDHYMILYQYLIDYKDREFRKLDGHFMENDNYANYARCRGKYCNAITRKINEQGYYEVDDAYDSKEMLYTISTLYNTIEYRGIRDHFKGLVSINNIMCRMFDVLHTLMAIDLRELKVKYKNKFIIKDE